LLGYDLMNEPHSMPNTQDWISMVAAAVPAIRAVDTNSYIIVGGNDYDNYSYGTQNPGILAITDPSNKLIYSAHVYPDNDDSGTHFDWVQQSTQASPKVTVNTGVSRMNTFVSWVATNKVVGYLGETGIANDNANWLVSSDLTLAAAQKANIMASVWAGGPWWPRTYGYYMDPVGTVDVPQMAVCRKYTGVYPSATAAVLTGTTTANSVVYLSENGVALTQVTADANGNWTATLSLANGVHVIVASTAALTADGTLAAICFNLV
jgi:endoglucanase